MRKYFVLAALPLLIAASAAAGDTQVGFSVGPTWAMSGESPITFNDFKDDFDTGFGIGAYVAGPFSGMIGWRGEFGYEKMSADADAATGGHVDGDYKIYRFQGGLQFGDFSSESKGKPYAFFTLGLAKEDFTISVDDDNIDLEGKSAFGLSFGGGYNYLIGDTWGVGGDLHVNAGFFDDDTRWWWTPSAQVFFKF